MFQKLWNNPGENTWNTIVNEMPWNMVSTMQWSCKQAALHSQRRIQDSWRKAPTPRGEGERPTYYSAKFSWKLHENEDNWTGGTSEICLCRSATDNNTDAIRGGSRIPRRRGRQPSRVGAPTYDFAKFRKKLHEIEKILGRRGGAPGAPPLIRHWQYSKNPTAMPWKSLWTTPSVGLRQHTSRMQCAARVIQKQFSTLSELPFLFMFIATYFLVRQNCHFRIPSAYIVHVIGSSAKR